MLKVKISPCRKEEKARQAKEFCRIYSVVKDPIVELVDSYDEADIVFVTDLDHKNIYADVLSRPEHIFHYNKILCYYEYGFPPEKIPGIYTGGCINFPATRGAFFYFWFQNHEVPLTITTKEEGTRPYLFSFMGRNCNKVRQNILNLESVTDSSFQYFLEDTSNSYPIFNAVKKQSKDSLKEQRDKYFNVLKKTKFALAPRGAGLSSIRQYEAMACGCVPVIISDKLKQPFAVNWDRCSVHVKEKDVYRVPQILSSIEGSFPEMSVAARTAYQQLLDPLIYWRYIEEAVLDIYKNDFGKRASVAELRWHIVLRAIRRTIYRRKQDVKRAIARFR